MIKDFVLSSDYPIDQVVYRSRVIPLTIASYDYATANVPHSVGGIFLPIAQYSLSGDFSSNTFGVGTSEVDANGAQKYRTSLGVYSDRLFIEANNWTAIPVTLYFRAIGLAIQGDHRSFAATSQYHGLLLNTDTNQLKLIKSGTVVVPSGAATSIPHSLGYVPTALVWQNSYWGVIAVDYTSIEPSDYGTNVIIDSQNLTITQKDINNTPRTYYYRIYADE